jgi:uncharacterized hydrophobic protein (TIGR00271 family)
MWAKEWLRVIKRIVMNGKNIDRIKHFFKEHIDLNMDKAHENDIIEAIKRGVEFKGINSWVLIFAIFTASLGLNTNSTAVIIGAMLISPLMGPIMGIGLAMGIYDFDLLKRAFKNFLIATIISLLTSFVYFLLSPMSDARSELLARTTPTVYDVLIAFFGGMAGIVAASSREKGNVIPGVAIATALMPPLCTAGYGMASGNWAFFLGAFYLYCINAVFISWATFLGARFFRFQKRVLFDPVREQKVTRYVWIVVIATLIPSIYLAYGIVRESVFISNANRFISSEMAFPSTQIIKRDCNYKNRTIDVILLGDEVAQSSIDIARSKMSSYGLRDATLQIRQSSRGDNADLGELKALVLEDFYKNSEQRIREKDERIGELTRDLEQYIDSYKLGEEMAAELRIIFPDVTEVLTSLASVTGIENLKTERMFTAVIKCRENPSQAEKLKLEQWLKARTKNDTLRLIIETCDDISVKH